MVGRGSQYTGNSSSTGCISWDDPRQIFFDTRIFTELKSAGASCRNPGGSRERPWCYVNLTSGLSENWKYCDVQKCRKLTLSFITTLCMCEDLRRCNLYNLI